MDINFTADLHCDLLSYLQEAPNASPMIGGRIGCTIPDLKAGHVKLQVMAIYTATEKHSTALALEQAHIYKNLMHDYQHVFSHFDIENSTLNFNSDNKINTIIAIENAAGICEEDDDLNKAFNNLNKLMSVCGKPLYLGLTHHGENRFGGGNNTQVGLKEDGKALINHLAENNIALDFSHTSDQLASDILNYLEKNNLHLPIIASHSNFRSVYHHNRNLPDDIAKEIIKRNGLIGINLLRAFLNPENANALYDHIKYGIQLGASHNLCFGADYFYCDSHPDQTRKPFFFPAHDSAAKYPEILNNIAALMNVNMAQQIGGDNLLHFIARNFSHK